MWQNKQTLNKIKNSVLKKLSAFQVMCFTKLRYKNDPIIIIILCFCIRYYENKSNVTCDVNPGHS